MDYYKEKNNYFEIFIKNSKNKSETHNNETDSGISKIIEFEYQDPMPSSIKNIIKNLSILTRDNKIIWIKDYTGIFRGIIIKNCIFSNFKIILENFNAEFDDYGLNQLIDFEPICRISLVKDILNTPKVEYLINLNPVNDEVIDFIGSIKNKLLQENN